MCRDFLTPDSSRQDNIQDTLSLFKELEDRKCLGVDRLQVLKDLLKGIRQWSLFGKVKKFESTRTEYNGLIEQIILVLDELNDMERLIAICRMAIAEANESNIQDVRSLFKELENNECLGIDCLGLLKEILTKTEQGDLLRDVEGFEARRNQEDEFESRKGTQVSLVVTSQPIPDLNLHVRVNLNILIRCYVCYISAQVADFMSSVGNRLIGGKSSAVALES